MSSGAWASIALYAFGVFVGVAGTLLVQWALS